MNSEHYTKTKNLNFLARLTTALAPIDDLALIELRKKMNKNHKTISKTKETGAPEKTVKHLGYL